MIHSATVLENNNYVWVKLNKPQTAGRNFYQLKILGHIKSLTGKKVKGSIISDFSKGDEETKFRIELN